MQRTLVGHNAQIRWRTLDGQRSTMRGCVLFQLSLNLSQEGSYAYGTLCRVGIASTALLLHCGIVTTVTRKRYGSVWNEPELARTSEYSTLKNRVFARRRRI